MAKIQSAQSKSSYTYSLPETGDQEARPVSIIFTGVQEQRPYKGQPKPDALVAKIVFELVGQTITKTSAEGETEQVPAILYWDIVIPAAGVTRGKAFEFIQATTGDEATYDDTEKYKACLNLPLTVKVGTYKNKDDKEVACVNGVSSMPAKYKKLAEDSTVNKVFFCCYADSPEMQDAYTKIGRFAQEKLANAKDADFIPAIKDQWPTEAPAEEDNQDEF